MKFCMTEFHIRKKQLRYIKYGGLIKIKEETICGIITKGIGGFYYVRSRLGTIECRARGVFRKSGIIPLVGDTAEISINPGSASEGVIEVIRPRKNRLVRPPVANVTQIAAVIAAANPRPNLYTLDKLILSAEKIGVKILVCINKTDLNADREYFDIYTNAGFDVLMLSAETGVGTDILKKKLENEITVFAGNSGVGKSSLLNSVFEDEIFETGEVSRKAERGKHTTRHSELMEIGSGYIIDTPGFGSFEPADTEPAELCDMFREFAGYKDECRFLDCSHTAEKDCAIIRAVSEGKISRSRYESYAKLYGELKNIRAWNKK